MADKRLCSAHRNLISPRLKELANRLRLDGIADRCRGRMGIDVVDVRWRRTGINQRKTHGRSDLFTIFARNDHVIGLAGCGVSSDLSVDTGLSFLSMGGGFQDQRTGSFAHDESIAQSVEGTRSLFRMVVISG